MFWTSHSKRWSPQPASDLQMVSQWILERPWQKFLHTSQTRVCTVHMAKPITNLAISTLQMIYKQQHSERSFEIHRITENPSSDIFTRAYNSLRRIHSIIIPFMVLPENCWPQWLRRTFLPRPTIWLDEAKSRIITQSMIDATYCNYCTHISGNIL